MYDNFKRYLGLLLHYFTNTYVFPELEIEEVVNFELIKHIKNIAYMDTITYCNFILPAST